MTQQRTPNSYDNLELKVGGKYLSRNGEEITIVLDRAQCGQFRFVDSNGNSYNNLGWFDYEYDSHNQMKEITLEYGLIEEISNPKQEGSSLNPFVFGDFVNSVIAAGSTVGQPGKVTGIVGDTVFVDWGTFTSQYNYRDLVVYSDARVGDNFLNHIMDDLDKQAERQVYISREVNSETDKFEDGDKVDVDINGVVKFYGTVVGKCCTETAVIGAKYMVLDGTGQFPNETYPYRCIGVQEIFMKQRN